MEIQKIKIERERKRALDLFMGEILPNEIGWEILMPVVEKICKEKYENGDTAYFRTFGMVSMEDNMMVRINRHQVIHGSTLLEAVFLAVSDYCLTLKK